MSISSSDTIMSRLALATEESPLALFKTDDGLDCVFASTVEAQQRKQTPSYVATLHGATPLTVVAAALKGQA